MNQLLEHQKPHLASWCRLFGLSGIGIFVFFAPITIGGLQSIPIDHIVKIAQNQLGANTSWYALLIITLGALYPLFNSGWRNNRTEQIFLILKWIGVIAGFLAVTKIGPTQFQSPDMLPFLFEKLVIPVSLIVPIGSIFLAFLVNYGMMESIGALMQKVMQPIWRTPGRSAIDALASFVGSYSIGLLITNRMYVSGHYSLREAAIIATGFSTVSATFMLIVAKALSLMDMWATYFAVTLIITFLVTAITARLPPLSTLNNEKSTEIPTNRTQVTLRSALEVGLKAADEAPSIRVSIMTNLKDGLMMTLNILPSIMSVGFIGLLGAKYTPIFDWIGFTLYPFIWVWGIDNSQELASAIAAGLAEMFLPALIMQDTDLVSRFVTGVVSVSSILFMSASIPCILSTKLPLKISHLIVIWFLRTALSLTLAIPTALILFE